MEIKFDSFRIKDMKPDSLLNILLYSLLIFIFTTFLNIIYKPAGPIGNLNIYGESELAPLLLISLFFEISTLINRNEKLFIPLRVVNTIFSLIILSIISNSVRRSEINTTQLNNSGNFVSGFISYLTDGFVNIPMNTSQPIKILFGYYLISVELLLCSIIFIIYLYFRFYRKEELVQTSQIKYQVQYRSFINVFTKNRLLATGTYLVIASQFLPFNSMNPYLVPTPAFAHFPLISLSICIIGILLIYSILNETNNMKRYIIIEILSIVIWNPFIVFRYGTPGIGYWLYIVGLGLLTYSILGNKLKINS